MSLSLNLPLAAARFRAKLSEVRHSQLRDFEWYPYDSLSNASHIERLLGGRYGGIFENPAASPILDIGCGDGDVSFLFESLGFPVSALDHASTNHNGMRGIHALRSVLNSHVEILEADIDSQFQLPKQRFRLALFLGLLYHLKNPFHALERLAKSCDYCLLSTRIARRLPDGRPMAPEHPLAYLLAADELNADDSNYWIFNEAGLRRLLSRTNWEVLEYFTTGDTIDSDPVSIEHDERAFCLLRSHYGIANIELQDGWYEPEDTGWRWVRPRFSFRIEGAPQLMTMRVYLPPEVFAQLGAVTLRGDVDGAALPPQTLTHAGTHTVTRKLPAGALVTFETDKALIPEQAGGRELALIVASIDVE